MRLPKTAHFGLLTAWTVGSFALGAAWAQPSDVLQPPPPWETPQVDQLKAETWAWLHQQQAEEEVLQRADQLWSALPPSPSGDQLLLCLAETFSLVDQRAAALVQLCSQPARPRLLPQFSWLHDPNVPPLVAPNLRLLLARWLVHQRLYDEALEQIAELRPDDVAAPALLLFYQGVVHHALLQPEAGMKAIDQLLAGAEQSPRRYVAVARLMQQDLQTLDEESLDHIARRMGDIGRRLDLGRAGKRVQQIENGVIESLDKLIKRLEQQQQQQGGSSGGGNLRPSNPAPDSAPLAGKGRGAVVKRPTGNQSGWGDLPPRQREQALQQISRQFPAHYRDVVEQYFRRLANEENN